MKVLVIGSGGREHALCWKIAQSPRVSKLWCAPGNGGIGRVAECIDLPPDDLGGLLDFARSYSVDLTVVGPELPLTLGIVDRFEAAGLRVFGPREAGARLEASKAFTKALLKEAGVATASYREFRDADAATEWVREQGAPIVVKADGLAAGKGVTVATTIEEAVSAIDAALRDRAFGEAGARVIIEECLQGEEASFLAVTDGETVVPLATSQDHKRILDGDAGPNTGGMGAYSPAPVLDEDLSARIIREVLEPTVAALRRRGIDYRGVLYAGLMIHEGEAKVLEYNVRFGDPECQALLLRLRSDLVDLFETTIDRKLATLELDWDPRAAVCVVLAAAGYPGTVAKGDVIAGLDRLESWEDGVVFHAGTKREGDRLVTSGGRVLGVTALGHGIRAAIGAAYDAVGKISWSGMQYRSDIGARALGGRTAADDE